MSVVSSVFILILAAGLLTWKLPGPPRVHAILLGCAAGPFVPETIAQPLAVGLGLVALAAAGLSCTPLRLRLLPEVLIGEAIHLIGDFLAGTVLLLLVGASPAISMFGGLLLAASSPLVWPSTSQVPALQALTAAALVLFLPLLAGQEGALLESSRDFFAGVSFVALTVIAGQHLVPQAIGAWTAQGGTAALRVAAVIPIAVALLAEWIGPGLAVGTVLGGMLLRNDAPLSSKLPKVQSKVRIGFAFALGLLVDLPFIARHLLPVLGLSFVALGVPLLVSLIRRRFDASGIVRLVRVPEAPAYVLFLTGVPLLLGDGVQQQASEALFVAVAAVALAIGALIQWVSAPARPRRSTYDARGVGRLRIVTVGADSPAAGLSLRQLALHDRCGVHVVALWRRDAYYPHPLPELSLRPGDQLLLSAPIQRLEQSQALFRKHSFGRQ